MKKHVENLIIDPGPGGIQLAHDFEQMGIDYLVIEKSNKAGSFFETYPRHRRLISINKVYSDATAEDTKLRFDWNSLLLYSQNERWFELFYYQHTNDLYNAVA